MPATDEIRALKSERDYAAPDTSEIRLLVEGDTGGMAHCLLGAGKTTAPVRHRRVEELWYVLDGQGEIWRRSDSGERVDAIRKGDSFRIQAGTSFQFRAALGADLAVLIATIPPWPGPDEAEIVAGQWPTE